jgi:hypothetical protein
MSVVSTSGVSSRLLLLIYSAVKSHQKGGGELVIGHSNDHGFSRVTRLSPILPSMFGYEPENY